MGMRLAWATDIHLDFLADEQVRAFAGALVADRPDAVILSGDLSHAEQLEHHLRLLAGATSCPIYFVLGNHDYYGSSVAAVRQAVAEICGRKPRLRWLPACGVTLLSASTALIGCDGWGDARLGDPEHTPVFLNDFIHIEELAATLDPAALHDRARLRSVDRTALHAELRARGDAEAQLCERLVSEALAQRRELLVVTHVPPFAEACWHEGTRSDPDWLPYFTCSAVGEVLRAQARAHPGHQITVVCGHTHGAGEAQIEANLRVLTGGAEYRRPRLQRVLEVM